MKKTFFVLLCAALLTLAPSAFAADGSVLSLDGLFARLVAIFSSFDGDLENGPQFEPFGYSVESANDPEPPNSSAAKPTGDQSEMGWEIQPGG